MVSKVGLTVASGEIVGVTGLMGMGQDEIPYLLTGAARRTAGEVAVDGVRVPPSVRHSLGAGLALVPANRPRDSVWGEGKAFENLTLPFLKRFTKGPVLQHKTELDFAEREMRRFNVRPLNPRQLISRFSGGNQQKIVVARWLQMRPKVLLLHEPTQGVDVGAKKEIFNLIRVAAEEGAAVAIFSSDLEEVANVCHRVLVMRHGQVVGELGEGELSEQRLISVSQGSAISEAKETRA
jgi:ribose transport system ATP-binding protein